MIGPEFKEFTEEQHTAETVAQLKHAACYMQPQFSWESVDGSYLYSAAPLDYEPGEEPINLPELPIFRFYEIMNSWQLLKVEKADVNGDVAIDVYTIGAGISMRVSRDHVVPHDLLASNSPEEFKTFMDKEMELQADLGMDEPELIDYARVDNAMVDLSPIATRAFLNHMDALKNMTEDERRWKMAQKYEWLVTPEVDKLSGPRWWGFTVVSQAFAVYTESPDFGAVLLEEMLGAPLVFFFAEPYEEEQQLELNEKFEGREIVNLIPFSNEEWPEDPNNMTDAQKTAIDRLKRD